MQLLVRDHQPVIATAVERDVDRVSERSHRFLSLAAVAGPGGPRADRRCRRFSSLVRVGSRVRV
jgi:hypothetical protein